jgi:hypothetical protein
VTAGVRVLSEGAGASGFGCSDLCGSCSLIAHRELLEGFLKALPDGLPRIGQRIAVYELTRHRPPLQQVLFWRKSVPKSAQ